jgi:hypothetical protein
MKKLLPLFCLIALVECGPAANNSSTKTTKTDSTATTTAIKPALIPSGWKTYAKGPYTISYPTGWTLELDDSDIEFTLSSPIDSSQTAFNENLNLVKKDMAGENFNLDEMPEVLDGLKTSITDFKLISSERMKNSAGEYQKVVFSGTQANLDLEFEQRYQMVHDILYVSTLTALHNDWKRIGPIGDDILNTFTVKN